MMTTCTFSVSVVTPPQTYIEEVIATPAMWSGKFSVDLSTGMALDAPVGYDGSQSNSPTRAAFVARNSGGDYNLTDWTGKAHYDDARNEWWYCAGTTGWWPGSMTMIRYREQDNTWRHWQGANHTDPGVFGVAGRTNDLGQAHNFGSSAFDQSRGRIYRLINDETDWDGVPGAPYILSQSIGVWDVATRTKVALWENKGISINGYYSMDAFPDASCLCIFYHVGSTTIKRVSLDTGAVLPDWMKPATQNNTCTCYHSGRLYFTGDNGEFYSKGPTQADDWTTHAASPTAFNQNGSGSLDHTMLTHMGGHIYALKLCPGADGRGIYRFDPTANSGVGEWTTMTTVVPIPIRTGSGREYRWLAGALRSEGVVLIITASDEWGFLNSAYLWRP